MVASSDGGLYSPFPHRGQLEDGPQSSEEGSVLHSPIFDPPFHPDVRYQNHDIRNVAEPLSQQYASHYDVPSARSADGHFIKSLEIPNSSHTLHRADRNLATFNIGSPPRLPLPNGGGTDYSYNFSDRRLPDPHAGSYHRSSHTMSSGGETLRPVISSAFRTEEPIPSPSTSKDQRKQSSLVVIACRQCRARKIRCDSTRPMCHNCVKRGNECEYDSVPKRRGPDKHPGTRQRSCKKRPTDESTSGSKKKRRMSDDREVDVKENVTGVGEQRASSSRSVMDELLHIPSQPSSSVFDLPVPRNMPSDSNHSKPHGSSPTFRRGPLPMYENEVPKSIARPLDVNIHRADPENSQDKISNVTSGPSTDFSRKTWWDDLVAMYSPSRDQSLKAITEDLAFLFNTTNSLLSFINVPFFLRNLNSPSERDRIQPSLVYAGLAMSTLLKSSEVEMGAVGRSRAMWFRDAAQASLEASWNSQWIETSLAAAALILAVFESSAHPQHSPQRALSSLTFLDSIIRALGLTAIDADDPDASTFTRNAVPVVHSSSRYAPLKECSCRPISPDPSFSNEQLSYTWSSTPAWNPSWSDGEVQKEECRRLCWSSLTLVADYMAQCALTQEKPPFLFLSEPSNYKLFFPGEMLSRTSGYNSGQSPKDSVWALHCRSMLLWSSCQLLRDSSSFRSEGRADFAVDAWSEADAIQDALDRHTCNVDTALIYTCREFIYNTRLSVTHTLRRLVPTSEILQGLDSEYTGMFNRKHAEDWLYYQEQFAKRVKSSIHHLGDPQGHLLTRRPFCVAWFASQIATCLSLWERDRALVHALELAKSFLVPLDVLNALWPCPTQRSRCDSLRDNLDEACVQMNIPQPLPPHFSLPPMLHSQ